MSAQLLLHQFRRVAAAPDPVPRLRRFLMRLAVRGLLVPRDPSDGDGAALAKQLRAQRALSGRDGRRYSGPPAAVVPDCETPPWWARVTLGDTIDRHVGGGTPSKSNPAFWGGDISWASVKDVGPAKYLTSTNDRITGDGLANSTSNLVAPGSLIVVTRMGLGKVSINRIPVAINQDLRALTPSPSMSVDYQYLFLKTYGFEGSGLTVKGIRVEELLGVPFPLPPLAEQHRIVAKVDELMALCDEMEAAQTEREARRDRFRTISLRNLVASDDPGDSARSFIRNSPRMLTKPQHVPDVRQAILDLAVRGRLVPQDPRDEPTSELLRTCDDARTQVASKDRRANVEQQPMLATDLCWSVPDTWDWRGLADLVLFIDYRGKTPVKVESGIRLITAKNVRRGYLSMEPEEFVARAEYDRWMTRGLPAPGDVLFTTEAPMGNAAVVRLTEPFALAQRVINFRPFGATTPEFLALQLAAAPFQRILANTATGLTALGIKAAKLKRLPIGVPPLAEQHRIVAKVDELMAVCDELEHSLRAEQNERGRLLEALLHDTLEDGLPG